MRLRSGTTALMGLACFGALVGPGCFGDWTGTMASDPGTTGTSTTASPASTGDSTTSTGSTTSLADSSTSPETGPAAGTSSSSTGGQESRHVDLLIVGDVSSSMIPYGMGIASMLIALGANNETLLDEVDEYHVGLTANAPMAMNVSAFALPEGQDCTQLGALLRGQTECAKSFEGRAYISSDDPLFQSLSCLAEPFIGSTAASGYEDRLTLAALDAVLNPDPGLTACNDGFHAPGDPLLVLFLIDDEDASPGGVLPYVFSAIESQRANKLGNVGFLIVGADPSACDSEGGESGATGGSGGTECSAVPSCRVQEFVTQAFLGFEESPVRFTNICEASQGDPVDFAQEVSGHLVALYALISP